MTALAISNVVLWVLVLALSAVVLALTRQLGVLHERIAPAGALMLNRGLTVGEPAPALEVAALDGRALRLGTARDDGRSTLLLFVSPTCPVCKTPDQYGDACEACGSTYGPADLIDPISTLSGNFTQVVFALTVTPGLIVLGIVWAVVIGAIGGLFPAIRAARLPVAEALRAT